MTKKINQANQAKSFIKVNYWTPNEDLSKVSPKRNDFKQSLTEILKMDKGKLHEYYTYSMKHDEYTKRVHTKELTWKFARLLMSNPEVIEEQNKRRMIKQKNTALRMQAIEIEKDREKNLYPMLANNDLTSIQGLSPEEKNYIEHAPDTAKILFAYMNTDQKKRIQAMVSFTSLTIDFHTKNVHVSFAKKIYPASWERIQENQDNRKLMLKRRTLNDLPSAKDFKELIDAIPDNSYELQHFKSKEEETRTINHKVYDFLLLLWIEPYTNHAKKWRKWLIAKEVCCTGSDGSGIHYAYDTGEKKFTLAESGSAINYRDIESYDIIEVIWTEESFK